MTANEFAIGATYLFSCINRNVTGTVLGISHTHKVLDVRGLNGKRYSVPLDTIGSYSTF